MPAEMAYQQNPAPIGQGGSSGMPNTPAGVPNMNPQNPAFRQQAPGNYQWKGGPPQPPGVNGFTGPTGTGAGEGGPNQYQPVSGPPPTSYMNGPAHFQQPIPPAGQMNPNIRPGMSSESGQYRMQGPPQGGPRPGPPAFNSGPPVTGPGQRMQGPPPTLMGPPRMSQGQPGALPPHSRSQVPSELPIPFHGQGQYSHQVGTALTPGITPANSGPPSEQVSRDSSPALNQNFDALEGQFKPDNRAGQPGPPGQMAPPMSQNGPQPGAQPTSTSAMLGGPPLSSSTYSAGYQQSSGTATPPRGGPPMSSASQNAGYQQPPGTATPPRPGFPPAPTSVGQQPGFPPMSAANPRPGFPPQTSIPSQQTRFPPPPSSANQMSGFTPPPMSAQGGRPLFSSSNQQPGLTPPPGITSGQPGFAPPKMSSANQQPGLFPPPSSSANQPGFQPISAPPNQRPGFPPPPTSAGQQPGFQPPPTSTNQYSGFPPQPTSQYSGFPPAPANSQSRLPPPPTSNYQPLPNNQLQPPTSGFGQSLNRGKSVEEFVNTAYTTKPAPPGIQPLSTSFGSMTVQGPNVWNLVQQKRLIPPEGVEIPKPTIPNDFKNVNCSPEVFRCTLNAIPQTSALLNKARLPLGILIHPFKDLSQLPVIQSSVIVRCRSCRTYINPFVYFLDSRRWKCNLCYRVNELPDEFSFDPVSKTYGDPQRRPEIKSATIEFIAPSEYMLRPPQPAVYTYLFDVSFNAIETGYLKTFCKTILDVLDKIPGDSRTQICFIAYDSAVHFFNLAEGLSQPQMLTVTDVDDIFLPCPDDLMVNLNESKSLVIDLLNQLPDMFSGNMETRSALGAALQAAFKIVSGPGGRVTVMQTILPSIGPGALQNREDTQKSGKDIPNLGPATDFYKKLALDCSAQQVAVDLFMFNGQYADISSIECISKFSGGSVHYYPSYHAVRTPHLKKKFDIDLRRYLTRKIGFEAVMRIRCSKGLSIHTFHGNFFVRSTDLLSLPNINPDAGFGMQMSIEEALTDMTTMCFQAALLYTSSKGERRIRVHTLCLPITNQLSDIYASADQQAIVALLAKMAVDRSLTSSMSDAREAIVNATVDVLNSYGQTLPSTQRASGICINDELRLMPLYCLSLLKSVGFRTGITTKLDDRVFALEEYKTQPVPYLMLRIYPNLYPVHTIMDVEMKKKGQLEWPDLPVLQLSSANVDRNGAYILDQGHTIYLYVGSAISETFCQDILDKPNFASIQEGGIAEFPDLENEGSERFSDFIAYLMDSRPDGASFIIAREDGKFRMQFFSHFVEDRTESSMSYYEYLQHIQKQLKS